MVNGIQVDMGGRVLLYMDKEVPVDIVRRPVFILPSIPPRQGVFGSTCPSPI
jgi:hypothetical protein